MNTTQSKILQNVCIISIFVIHFCFVNEKQTCEKFDDVSKNSLQETMLFNTLFARATILTDAYILAGRDASKLTENLNFLNTDKMYCKGLGVLINKRARSTCANVNEDEQVLLAQKTLKDRFQAIRDTRSNAAKRPAGPNGNAGESKKARTS